MSRARTAFTVTAALLAGILVAPTGASAAVPGTVLVTGFESGTAAPSALTGSASAAVSAESTEGDSSLEVSYDVSGGLVELGYDPMQAPAIPTPVSALTVDLRGDGTYNTVYLRVRDSSGETSVHRVDAMRSTDWQTLKVDLTAEPVARDGGDGNAVLDAPLTLAGVLVVRNGEQPPTGTFALDDLRADTTGWTLPVAVSSYVSPQAGESAGIAFEAGGPGDWELRLEDPAGLSRTLTGTAEAAGGIAVDWDGLDDEGAAMAGDVRAVLRQDDSADGALGGGTTTGVPLLLTLAEADDPDSTSLVEAFDGGDEGWGVALGSATLRRATEPAAKGGAIRTEGADALAVDYDLSEGMAGITRTVPLDVATGPVTGLKVDLKGDGSYNTVYLRVADATGEAFTYRMDAMRHSTWTTVPIDLTQDPVLAEGGNADSVLDLPLTLSGFSVVRNGEQPATGTFLLDNLRAVSSRWTMPESDVEFLVPSEGGAASLGFTAASAGDWMIVLRDGSGRSRTVTGTLTTPGENAVQWDGTADDGEEMDGPIRSMFLQDSTPDGEFSASRTRSATPTLLTVAAAQPSTTSVVEGFEAAASTWRVAMGSATISRTSAQKTQGSYAQRIDYDVSSGLVETVQNTPATMLTKPASALRIDLKGDGTYNTVYARLRDASGETFTYRLDAMRSTAWATIDVDLTAPAALVEGGDSDHVLDMPVKLSGVIVVRNGSQPATGTVVLDNLRTLASGWSLPTAATSFFTPAPSASTSLSFTAGGPGDYRLELRDKEGRLKTITGRAAAAGAVSVPWDGSDDSGTRMRGDISGVFGQDGVNDGTLASNATRSGIPLLLTVAEVDADASLAQSFDAAGTDWMQAAGSATPSTSTTRTEGSGALRIAYDLTSADAEIETRATPVPLLTQPATALKVDLLGDSSWNTVFLKLRDATGEMFFYRVDAMSLSRWTTATVDLRSPAATTHLGNDDGVLDYPVSLVRINVVRNGPSAPATGTVVLDNLRVLDKDWTLPAASAPRFSRENAATTAVRFTAGTPGDYALVLRDSAGRTRTFGGTAASAGEIAVAWDGTDDRGAGMSGSIAGRLTWDATPNGSLTGAATATRPYLTGVSARATEAAPRSISGINSFLTEQDSPVEVDRQAALLEDAQVRWAREEFEWKRVEPRKGYYDWAKFDQAVAVSQARNVDMIGKLVYSAPWASSAPAGTPAEDAQYYPPRSTADFASYAAATVARYKDRVHVWEVWNEPNTDYYWRGGATAAQYGELLKAAHTAIKAVDPTATVLVGGLDQFSDPFMRGVLSAGAGDSFDGLAVHTYTVDGAPETGAIPTYLDAAQSFLDRSAPGRSLWITEVSWATCTTCVGATSEADQASYLSRSYLDAAARGIKGIAWYNLVGGSNPQEPLDTFSVTERSGRLKPSYTALKEVGAILAAGTAVGRAGATASASSVLVDDLASTSGYVVAPIGGGSASLAATSAGYSGAGALTLTYDFSGSSKGAQIHSSRTLPGSPTAVSVQVRGDASTSPVYLKLKDATGETFQGLVGNVGGSAWQRMTLFSDGLNPNYTHSGGDNDGVWDYPVTLVDTFVYTSMSGVTSGSVTIDDVTADYGVNVHGTVFQTPTETVQALFTAAPASASVQVSGAAASVRTAAGRTPLAVADAHATAGLGRTPTFVASAPGVTRSGGSTSLDWMTGDGATTSVAVLTAGGSVAKQLTTSVRYLAGRQVLAWDGRLTNGTVAPAGSYSMRITTTTFDGRAIVQKVGFTQP
ncbi:endo-1,4-beta-xylanase [Rathayibacter tanaceti]|uniref:Cellulase family glycosylhydrolase n=2 Tax=Rathayibacter tanaceti TaxID=1671680 RepID=A0A166HU52_9MICO|nr:endo-1,4-beta-xylanase [Rathayibacter tanaceti]KZX21161.1 flagellar basal body rod modification protein [Rathayibacter tanaceti]QHC54245.1 cellulase family glycosylhydrolase [Rathayibacter tanaceti]TCO37922.1 GH35 family endo-1,4-beta-xylanase [Rathayibacter tanaceti]